MKQTLLFLVFLSFATQAQTVDVKDVPSEGEGTTTIEIRKGKAAEPAAKEGGWEVQDGTADVEGDAGPMLKEARSSWKKACDEWKKEFRADNKENKIISINCGTPSCGGDAGNKTCTSKAKYKVKTKI